MIEKDSVTTPHFTHIGSAIDMFLFEEFLYLLDLTSEMDVQSTQTSEIDEPNTCLLYTSDNKENGILGTQCLLNVTINYLFSLTLELLKAH